VMGRLSRQIARTKEIRVRILMLFLMALSRFGRCKV
jgi:hypothetical protein